jgi:hypothetical protein
MTTLRVRDRRRTASLITLPLRLICKEPEND